LLFLLFKVTTSNDTSINVLSEILDHLKDGRSDHLLRRGWEKRERRALSQRLETSRIDNALSGSNGYLRTYKS